VAEWGDLQVGGAENRLLIELRSCIHGGGEEEEEDAQQVRGERVSRGVSRVGRGEIRGAHKITSLPLPTLFHLFIPS